MGIHQSKEILDNYFKKKGGYRTSLEREETWDEAVLTKKLSQYLKENHPTIPFTCDMSGVNLSKNQANQSSQNRANSFKVPDLLIFVKRGNYGMLALELKILKVKLFKRDGKFVKNEHLEKQRDSILWLRECDMAADFSIGYASTIQKINDYLSKGEINYTL